jgi:hypothetical protein
VGILLEVQAFLAERLGISEGRGIGWGKYIVSSEWAFE